MMSSLASMESTCEYQINVFFFFLQNKLHFKSDNKYECTWHVVTSHDTRQEEACDERVK